MSEKKELNQEQLEKVTGGDYDIHCSGNLSDYAAYINPITTGIQGQNYLFKTKNGCISRGWIFGTLSNQYKGFMSDIYTYDIKVINFQLEDRHGSGQTVLNVSNWGTIEFKESEVQMYSK